MQASNLKALHLANVGNVSVIKAELGIIILASRYNFWIRNSQELQTSWWRPFCTAVIFPIQPNQLQLQENGCKNLKYHFLRVWVNWFRWFRAELVLEEFFMQVKKLTLFSKSSWTRRLQLKNSLKLNSKPITPQFAQLLSGEYCLYCNYNYYSRRLLW